MDTPSRNDCCRRRAPRFPLPLEVELTRAGQPVTAILRDASVDEHLADGAVGVGLLHNEELPLHEPLPCQPVLPCDLFGDQARLTLAWTRSFGTDGFLSGGQLECRVSLQAADGVSELSGVARGESVS